MMNISVILLFAGNVAFNAAANLLMKIGIKRASEFELNTFQGVIKGLLFNYILITGVFAYMTSLVFYLFAIKSVKLSIAYPISVSCAIVLVTLLSSLLLKESISVMQIIGGIIILLGIFIMTR